MFSTLGASLVYTVLALLSLGGLAFIHLYIKETKGLTRHQINLMINKIERIEYEEDVEQSPSKANMKSLKI